MKTQLRLSNIFIIALLIGSSSCQSNEQNDKNPDLTEYKTVLFDCDYLEQKLPNEKAELFSPNFISTKVEHSAVMFTPDGSEIWFGRMYPAKIWYLTNTNGIWSTIKKASLDDSYRYLYPFLSPDGNKIYFTSDRPERVGKERQYQGDGDLWYIERARNNWGEPIHLGEIINFGNRHAIGSVSASGNIYYTARTGKLYNYTTKMYFAELVNGKYKTPVDIKELNSDQPSHSPYVSPDESYLIFSSFRSGMGMSDLFISFREKDGKWSTPMNLGPNINSVGKDEYPYVGPDGKYLFFNSNRISELNSKIIQNGPGNMYWVDAGIIEDLRTKFKAN